MTLLEIANKIMAEDEIHNLAPIGFTPIYEVNAQWFVDRFQEVVRLQPKAATWDDDKIYCAMCLLYLVDPRDFVE